MSAPQEGQPDQMRIVAFLARESHAPIDDVAKIYEDERVELASEARVTKFLHIFATRNTQDILRERDVDRLAVLAAGRRPEPSPVSPGASA